MPTLTSASIFLERAEIHPEHEAIVLHGDHCSQTTILLGRKNGLRHIYDELHKIYGDCTEPYELETDADYVDGLFAESANV